VPVRLFFPLCRAGFIKRHGGTHFRRKWVSPDLRPARGTSPRLRAQEPSSTAPRPTPQSPAARSRRKLAFPSHPSTFLSDILFSFPLFRNVLARSFCNSLPPFGGCDFWLFRMAPQKTLTPVPFILGHPACCFTITARLISVY